MALITFLRALRVILYTPWLLSRFVFDVLFCILPWTRPAREWSLNQAIRVRAVRLVLLYWSLLKTGDHLPLNPGKERNRFAIIQPAPSKLYQGPLQDPVVRPQPVGATWTPARPPPPAVVGPNMTVALHFHGGAFVIGDGRDHDAGFTARTLIRHMGCTHVCSPQYRLSSHRGCHFPSQLQDAVTSYVYLLRERRIPARQIVFSGDSAGGNLALGLLRYIHEHGRELDLPAPGAVTLWSPWVDVSAALLQDMRMSPHYKTDYLNADFGRWGAVTITNGGAIDPANPYLSPLHHPFRLEGDDSNRNVPMYINGGDREVLSDDIRAFAKAYGGLGWDVHLCMSRGCPHDAILLGDRMGFGREAEEAAREAREFLLRASTLYLRG
ncbi:hypothetical protein ACO1O0_002458 [Amphichorda felina]